MFQRSKNICDSNTKAIEDTFVRDTLKRNGYPSSTINQCFRKINDSCPLNIRDENLKFVKTPYIKGATEKISRMMKPFSIGVASKPSNNVKSLLGSNKDDLPAGDKNSIVYQFSCNDCSGIYIGETGRQLKTRLHEHRLAVARGDPRSLVSKHVLDNGHSINWNSAKVLDAHSFNKGRKILETFYTSSEEGAFNRCIEVPQTYLNICNKILR